MVERVREGGFIIDLVYQIRVEACHGGAGYSVRHFAELKLPFLKFKIPLAAQGEVKSQVSFYGVWDQSAQRCERPGLNEWLELNLPWVVGSRK